MTDCGCGLGSLCFRTPKPHTSVPLAAKVAKVIGDHFDLGGGCVRGHDRWWDNREAEKVASAAALEVVPVVLSARDAEIAAKLRAKAETAINPSFAQVANWIASALEAGTL